MMIDRFARVQTTAAATSMFFILAAFGCSSNEKQTYPTRGKIVWADGTSVKELAEGMVIFECKVEQISAKGPIDEQGQFVLGTYSLTDGAVAGKHKVAIMQPAAGEGDYKPRQVVNSKYESMETTDLEVTIEPKQNDVILKVTPGSWMKRKA